MIKVLFLDIGGVLMTNGWGHELRETIAHTFNVDYIEMDRRHHLVFNEFETGKISFDHYLNTVVFYEKRSVSLNDLKKFIFNAVRPFPEMLHFFKEIKELYPKLKIVMVSNEGRELILDRIQRFELKSFIDFFIVSAFVGIRKPDPAIYKLALDLVLVSPSEIAYVDDRAPLIETANGLGIHGIHHTDAKKTQQILRSLLL